jgi:hypothetical protein
LLNNFNNFLKVFEKLINIGFDESINRDINLLNISVEKKLLKKNYKENYC